MKRFWNEKLDNLLRRHYAKGDLDALAQRIGTTKGAVKGRAQRIGLKRKVNVRQPWTERQLAVLREHYADKPMEWLMAKTHHKRDSIENKAHDLGIYKSKEFLAEMGRQAAQRPGAVASRFKKGLVPANKGKRQTDFMSAEGIERTKATRFKPGQQPANTRPVGYERIDDDGYVLIKVEGERKMTHKHRHVWRQHHGEIPDGYCVSFRDGNKQNCDISNLFLISREDNARRRIEAETPEQRRARADKMAATLREQDRKDRLRLHWGMPTKHGRIKRW